MGYGEAAKKTQRGSMTSEEQKFIKEMERRSKLGYCGEREGLLQIVRAQEQRIGELENKLCSVTTLMACRTCSRGERARYMIDGLCGNCVAAERDELKQRIGFLAIDAEHRRSTLQELDAERIQAQAERDALRVGIANMRDCAYSNMEGTGAEAFEAYESFFSACANLLDHMGEASGDEDK